MEINLKKWLWILVLSIAGYSYVSRTYGLDDALKLIRKKNDPLLTPKAEYYVGMARWLRNEMPQSGEAFEAVLAHPTTGYYTPKAIYRLGMVYSERKNWEDARRMYLRYIEEYPQGDNIESVQKKYEVIKFR